MGGADAIAAKPSIHGQPRAQPRLLPTPETRRYLKDAERELLRAAAISNQPLRFYKQATRPRLTEVDEIIRRHHGTLKVRSSPCPGHSGTAFTVFLPFNAVDRSVDRSVDRPPLDT